MKFNWGHGITIFFSLFVLFMLTLLYLSTQENIDLVTEEYYAEELKYEDRIVMKNNATDAGLKLNYSKLNGSIELSFEGVNPNATGTVVFYRPSDAKMDFTAELALDISSKMSIPQGKFSMGLYQIQVQIEMDGKPYYIEKTLSI